MCLPRLGRVIEIAESEAVVDVDGIRSIVNVMCVPHVAPDDHVMIHAGYAVSILTSAEAAERQTLLDAVRTGEPLTDDRRQTTDRSQGVGRRA